MSLYWLVPVCVLAYLFAGVVTLRLIPRLGNPWFEKDWPHCDESYAERGTILLVWGFLAIAGSFIGLLYGLGWLVGHLLVEHDS